MASEFVPNRVLLCLLVSLCLPGTLAHAFDAPSPQQAGFVAERLQRIDQQIEQSIADGEIPGAVALVVRDGKVVYHKAFGHADIAAKKAMQQDSIFRIASMTKAVTTVAAMMLYEQGHFRLSDAIAEYLPAFANAHVITATQDDGSVTSEPATAPVRIIDLLTHTSGLGYPFIPSAVQQAYVDSGIIDGVTASDQTLAAQMARLARQPLLFQPGARFEYGLSSDLLGYLVEVVSGQSLADFFAEHIFAPLRMQDTYFYLPVAKAHRLATLYAHLDGEALKVSDGSESDIKIDDPLYPVQGARTYYSGGAGLSSTAYDYARFIQMLLNEGALDGKRILGRKSVQLMRTARVDWDDDGHADFGLGFEVVGDLGKSGELGSVGAYRWGGAFNTSYWIDPEERLVGVFMSQVRPVQANITRRFSTLVYQALE